MRHLIRPTGRVPCLRLAAGSALLLVALAVPAAGLSFDAALALAGQDAPVLKAARARAEAARQGVVPAGELPDPKLSVGIENLPVGGPDRYTLTRDFMTMQRIAVMQEIPNGDKREARVAAAQARARRAASEQRIATLTVRREAALAWIRRHTVERQLALFDALLAENRLLDASAQAQLAAGRGTATDALMPRQEAAMLAERREELQAQREQAIAALRRWIGDAGTGPLTGDPPQWTMRREDLEQHLPAHPELVVLADAARVADAELREAEAMKKSDWALELAYQRRGRQFGDMVSVQLSFDLPWFASRRQDPQIAARQAERAGIDAEREAMQRDHLQALRTDWSELERLDRALARNRNLLQPLARDRIALSLAAYQGGKGTLAEHVAARRDALEIQLRSIALQGERNAAAARLSLAHEDAEPAGDTK